MPDPQDEATFRASRLDSGLCHQGWHAILFGFYRRLIALRTDHPRLLGVASRKACAVTRSGEAPLLLVSREGGGRRSLVLLNFGTRPATVALPGAEGWAVLLDSSAGEWGGPGALVQGEGLATGSISYAANPMSVAVLMTGAGGA